MSGARIVFTGAAVSAVFMGVLDPSDIYGPWFMLAWAGVAALLAVAWRPTCGAKS